MERVPAPEGVVCDGGAGIASALRRCWPITKVQRCLFHVQMNVRQHLTLRPRTDAGRALLGLSRALSTVRSIDDAIAWQLRLHTWWQAYGHLTRERSRNRWQSWYTHDRLRKAYQLLERLTRNRTLFTHLEHGTARTTSPLEGGINNGIRTVLRAHRGMSEAHMKRAAEWFLYTRQHTIEDAYAFTKQLQKPPEQIASNSLDNDDEPSIYGTALTAEEGLWHRSGWAGRT